MSLLNKADFLSNILLFFPNEKLKRDKIRIITLSLSHSSSPPPPPSSESPSQSGPQGRGPHGKASESLTRVMRIPGIQSQSYIFLNIYNFYFNLKFISLYSYYYYYYTNTLYLAPGITWYLVILVPYYTYVRTRTSYYIYYTVRR